MGPESSRGFFFHGGLDGIRVEAKESPHAREHWKEECCCRPPQSRQGMAINARNANGTQQSQPRATAQAPQYQLRAFSFAKKSCILCSMQPNEIRAKYMEFFERKGHTT